MISTRSLPDGAIDGRQAVTAPSPNRVVSKPIPSTQADDPRRYQIEQMKRRFSAAQNNLRNGTTNLAFRLRPSDPDFPFELEFLECELQVPSSYPEGLPVLRVKNTDIPRGFSVNIERGWERLVRENEGVTLLSLTNALDKNLEAFLTERKVDIVTLVAFKDTRHIDSTHITLSGLPLSTNQSLPLPALPTQASRRAYVPEESFTKDEIADAKARRAQDVRQLESRMGRVSLYQKSADGVVYTLPLEPKRRSELPVGLQSIQSVQLIVPLLYPLQQLRILLNDVDLKDVEAIEEAFASRAAQQRQMTLTSHMNYLSQNLHILVKQAHKSSSQATKIPDIGTSALENNRPPVASPKGTNEDGRTHIHIIPRPPEWSIRDESEESEDSDDDSWDSDESGGGVAVSLQNPVTEIARQAEKGTSISFPSITLHNIELLQVVVLSLSVKCERCRTLNDISNLRPEVEKASSCKKCATAFTVKFRQEMVHQNSVRAGFIDVSGCTVADMLPSTFVPTCSKCSTPSLGLVSVRGEVTTNVCRECHGKFTFKIPEVKFLAITHGSAAPPTTGPRRRQEKLGLHVGESLPDRGACAHYKRSYRWFRFSCCGKVHPCDRCHDAAEQDHVQEWANRMICGWCSREQNFAPEACAFCGRSVIGKKGRGFWEGGKGTRDRRLMSRKDKRKFRRTGGGGGDAQKD